MKVLTEGHKYELSNFESKESKGQELQFIEKEGKLVDITQEDGTAAKLMTLATVNDGTTNEEVLEALIDRMQYLQSKFPCKENACCITHMQEALMWLEKRTSDRLKRNVEGKHLS